MIEKLGYGKWEELKVEIRKAWQFRFDWYLKSRTPQELQKRVESLVRLIEKEAQDSEDKDKVKANTAAFKKVFLYSLLIIECVAFTHSLLSLILLSLVIGLSSVD